MARDRLNTTNEDYLNDVAPNYRERFGSKILKKNFSLENMRRKNAIDLYFWIWKEINAQQDRKIMINILRIYLEFPKKKQNKTIYSRRTLHFIFINACSAHYTFTFLVVFLFVFSIMKALHRRTWYEYKIYTTIHWICAKFQCFQKASSM